MWFFKLIFWVCSVLLVFHLLTKKFLDPFPTYMVVGKKGSGKTTTMIRLIYHHLRKGWNVYCTDHIEGTTFIDHRQIGRLKMQPNSVLFVDEVGMIWDARKYKDFPDHLRDFFKLSRHHRIKIYLFSQTFDVDKKIRDLTDGMYLVTKFARVFSYAKRIIMVPDLVKPSALGPARVDDVLKFDSIFFFWCGSRMLTFIPKYAGLFDSHVVPDLSTDPGKLPPMVYHPPVHVPKKLLPKVRRKRTNSKVLFCCVEPLWLWIRASISRFSSLVKEAITGWTTKGKFSKRGRKRRSGDPEL